MFFPKKLNGVIDSPLRGCLNYDLLTDRYTLKGNGLEACGKTTNAGVSSYICEMHTKHSSADKEDISRFLKHILEERMYLNNSTLWGWEARPNRSDYFYPPDWDDTCKAIDAIESYKANFTNKELDNIELPSKDDLMKYFFASLFEKKDVGEDSKFNCKNNLALFMFISDFETKPNNTEDIFVTAVTVRTMIQTLRIRDKKLVACCDELMKRVFETVEKGFDAKIPLSHISRCYLSWGFLVIILFDISRELRQFLPRCEGLMQHYIDKKMYSSSMEEKIMKYLINDEFSFGIFISNYLDKYKLNTIHKERLGILNECQSNGVSLIYQHRRLKHYYGSQTWSSLLNKLTNNILLVS